MKNKLFCLLIFILLFVVVGCQKAPVADADKALTEYKIYINSLDKKNIETISEATNKYKELFAGVANDVYRSNGFDAWQGYFYSVLEEANTKLSSDSELNVDLQRIKSPDYSFSTTGDPKESTVTWVNSLKKSGIKLAMSEGMFYLAGNDDYVVDNFMSMFSEPDREFMRLRAEESKQGFTEDASLRISWDDLRKRIITWEKYISKYPATDKKQGIEAYLDEYIRVYLSGVDNSRLTGFEGNTLLPAIKSSYENFISENKDSKYYSVVAAYYELWKSNNFALSYDKQTQFMKENNLKTMIGVQPSLY